jgi:hypothetical protein
MYDLFPKRKISENTKCPQILKKIYDFLVNMPADTIAKQEENQRVMREPEVFFDAPFSFI